MRTLLIEIESDTKTKEVASMLSSMDFVKKVSTIKKPAAMINALQEHVLIKKANLKKKNKAIAKYL